MATLRDMASTIELRNEASTVTHPLSPTSRLAPQQQEHELMGWEIREQAKVAGYRQGTGSPPLSPSKQQTPPSHRRLINTDRSCQIPPGFVCCLGQQAIKVTKNSSRLNKMRQDKLAAMASRESNPKQKAPEISARKKSTLTKKQANDDDNKKFPMTSFDYSDDDDSSSCSTITLPTINSFDMSFSMDDGLMFDSNDRWIGSDSSPIWCTGSIEKEDAKWQRRNQSGYGQPIKEIVIQNDNFDTDIDANSQHSCVCPYCGLNPREQQNKFAVMTSKQAQLDASMINMSKSSTTIGSSCCSGPISMLVSPVSTKSKLKIPAWKLRLQAQQQAIGPPMAPIRRTSGPVEQEGRSSTSRHAIAATSTITTTTPMDRQIFVPTRRESPIW